MSYKVYSIKEVIEKINKNEIYLPAIQRKFVWKPAQIEKLFDSIMRGYPIGTFLFWFLKEENVNKYTFYKFIQKYHQRDNNKNEISPRPELKNNIIGVLDGQQRLSSMYIALQGTYAYKKPYYSWNNDNAFPERELYLNLINNGDKENNLYEFKFLTNEEHSVVDDKQLWFNVKDVLTWGEDPEIDDYYDALVDSEYIDEITKNIIKLNKKEIKSSLRILHKRIVQDGLISYFEVKEQELDNILDIFVRVNSSGTVLSKTDLLFSTIVAHWERGREEIDQLVDVLNKKGEGFRFDSDFVMRSCLTLTEAPIIFKVESFKQSNILEIMNKWNDIKIALEKSIDLLVEFGFSYENLTSNNAVIPIAYYYLNSSVNDDITKKELRTYLISSLIKKIYGNQGDQVLAHVREAFKSCIDKVNNFDFCRFANEFERKGRKSIRITKSDIEDILEYKKGAYTFMVLSLLYPNLKYGQVKFHQDHIHPASLFTDSKLQSYNIDKSKREDWKEMKDKLANLQIMEGLENKSKNKTPFKEWVNNQSNVSDVYKYKMDNYIDLKVSEEFEYFDMFYNKRREIIKEKLMLNLL
ncbi:DUF262 domain-containing protein [Paraclostridium sordellii]|uniref:DUF262 domain-containing protein n=1 Tax=Paraclostridium sordellii TaxID=1505 RepID=UPI0005E578A0|nr:DUF262 domain-containing protein [Paeniclostridium sordellii]CEO23154.1 Uncharacterized conserved protein [[Clostridium] sordellii] [Paeniclostridium sordellii]